MGLRDLHPALACKLFIVIKHETNPFPLFEVIKFMCLVGSMGVTVSSGDLGHASEYISRNNQLDPDTVNAVSKVSASSDPRIPLP